MTTSQPSYSLCRYQQKVASMRSTDGDSPIPGNPTPSLTPATSMNSDPTKLTFNEMKSPVNFQNKHLGRISVITREFGAILTNEDEDKNFNEWRLAFPLKYGIILEPFRLEHNITVSNHVFQLDRTDKMLMKKSDIELQLKCFYHEDKQMNPNWPACIQISVNNIPLTIDRGKDNTSHKSLYVQNVCRSGENTIQITVSECCCSHLFVLRLVYRPKITSAIREILHPFFFPRVDFIAKIKRNFSSNLTNNGIQSEKDTGEQTALKVSLKCPITSKRILLPAKGHECTHIQCFDLESYLQLNCERDSWICPVCIKPVRLKDLEIDCYMMDILNVFPPKNAKVDEVIIDSLANWKFAKNRSGIKSEKEKIAAEMNRLTMSTFVPTKHNLREALLFCFHLKKSAADGHRLLCEAYREHAPSIKTCEYWFRRFKSGDFDTSEKRTQREASKV